MTLAGRHVVIVLQSFRLGGAERQALHLAGYLVTTAGARVTVVGLSSPDAEVPRHCDRLGLPHAFVPFRLHGKPLKMAPALLRLGWRLRRLAPDVLVPFLNVANVACGLLWRAVGARASIWNQRDQGWSWRERPIVASAIYRTPFFVANSRGGSDFLISAGVDTDKVRSLPNGVELAPPRESADAWRHHLGIRDDGHLVVMVAHVHRRKDHATLLRAWRLVLDRRGDRGRDAVLALAGIPGDAFDDCQALVRELGLEQSVRFLGEVRDVSGLLHAADLGVLSSHHEGCPNAVLESMAAGLPVLGTDIPSIREILMHDEFLVPAQDPDIWADRIVRLLADEDLRRRVGARNRELAATEYSPRRQFQGWTDLIAQAIGQQGVTRS